MITVTSKNRTAARRLLNNWHPSTRVRRWSLQELTTALITAVNQDFITQAGVLRALNIEQKRGERRQEETRDDGRQESPQDLDDTDLSGENETDTEGDSETETVEGGDDDGTEGDDETDDESETEDDDDQQQEQEEEQEQEQEQEEEQEQDDDSPIEHPMLQVVLKYIRAGLNVALVGPAGTGKSYMARQVAGMLDRDFYVNGAMLSKYDLIGYCDAAGTYHPTPAYNAFVNGGLHCFDELDGSAPDAVVAFNGMTDDQPFYTFPDGQHDQHEDYVAIACMNTWGNGATADYVGRYKQDAAAMSRFVKVFIDYDDKIESRCGSKDIVQRVQAVRRACENLGIRHIVSTRMIIQAEASRKAKVTRREIDRDVIFAGLDTSAINQIAAAMKAEKAGRS